jgi:predicted small metal-binding protein
MDIQCPRCDFIARGADESEAREQLKVHMKEAHQVDEGSFESMLGDMKQKITGMFKR